ncbi:MAG: nicotinamide riboside transporter PnuC [Dysgonamonadaceae bacterium]|jgi:nicotinamide mononucleotide transporter|nr:nicotinamide riboside transporter PnuC [Dysgonamonadaceae bacterium]
MIDWIKNNYIETTGASLALIYLILEVRQKWTMWIVGIVSSIFYVFIFFNSGLYAEMGMNAYFAIMSVYGLYCWKYAKNSAKELKTTNVGKKTVGILFIVGVVLSGIILWILIKYTDSPVPYADTLVTVLSIIATWMVAHKYLENWYIWIFTNFFAIGLYTYQELYPTAILYVVYAIMSIIGLIEWRKSMKREHE